MNNRPNGAFAAITFGVLMLAAVIVVLVLAASCQRAQPPGAGVYQGVKQQEEAR